MEKEIEMEKFAAFEEIAKQVLNLTDHEPLWVAKGEIEVKFAFEVWKVATAREARLVEALEHYRFKCERGYCGHAHRDELPKCHVEGCECVSLDNRAAAALAEYRGEKANTEEKHDDD